MLAYSARSRHRQSVAVPWGRQRRGGTQRPLGGAASAYQAMLTFVGAFHDITVSVDFSISRSLQILLGARAKFKANHYGYRS